MTIAYYYKTKDNNVNDQMSLVHLKITQFKMYISTMRSFILVILIFTINCGETQITNTWKYPYMVKVTHY